jgi:predicted DNA-binding antitoxin AbrB/MazE fold protein
MIKSIEGIYQDGEIRTLQSVPLENGTPVLIVFADSPHTSDESGKNVRHISVAQISTSDKPELDEIDVSIETKEEYERMLSGPSPNENSDSEASFFDLAPVDIGRTDPKIIDRIIGGVEK